MVLRIVRAREGVPAVIVVSIPVMVRVRAMLRLLVEGILWEVMDVDAFHRREKAN